MMSNLNLNSVTSLDTGREVDVNRVMQTVDYVGGLAIDSRDTVIVDGDARYVLAASAVLPYTTTGAGMPEGGAFVSVGDAALRQDLANPDKGAAMVARAPICVDSIADLLALPVGQRKEGVQYLVKGYHSGFAFGGGAFYWSALREKSEHNGGTVIDPERPHPSDWSSASDVENWLTASDSGKGCFVRESAKAAGTFDDTQVVLLEDFGALGGSIQNHLCIQAALDSGLLHFSYVHTISFRSTIYFNNTGIRLRGCRYLSQYSGAILRYLGPPDTWGIHVKAPGCAIVHNNFQAKIADARTRNGILVHRDHIETYGGADIDVTIMFNALLHFKSCIKAVGRNAVIVENAFSGYTNGIILEQFRNFVDSPEVPYHATLERGYRGMLIKGNTSHASGGIFISNRAEGAENLYGCTISDNEHDTLGIFFIGSLKQSRVADNTAHRMTHIYSAYSAAFILETCRDVLFSGNMIGGEIEPLSDATMPDHAFKFLSRDVSGVQIIGGIWKNILGSPIDHDTPPIGSFSVSGVSLVNCAARVALGEGNAAAIANVRSTISNTHLTDIYRVTNCTVSPAPAAAGFDYPYLVQFSKPELAYKGVDVFENSTTNAFDITPCNLEISSGDRTGVFPYIGDGSASKTIVTNRSPVMCIITPLSSTATNRFQTVTVLQTGTRAAEDVAEIIDGGIIVKGDLNTSGVVYSVTCID